MLVVLGRSFRRFGFAHSRSQFGRYRARLAALRALCNMASSSESMAATSRRTACVRHVALASSAHRSRSSATGGSLRQCRNTDLSSSSMFPIPDWSSTLLKTRSVCATAGSPPGCRESDAARAGDPCRRRRSDRSARSRSAPRPARPASALVRPGRAGPHGQAWTSTATIGRRSLSRLVGRWAAPRCRSSSTSSSRHDNTRPAATASTWSSTSSATRVFVRHPVALTQGVNGGDVGQRFGQADAGQQLGQLGRHGLRHRPLQLGAATGGGGLSTRSV